MRPYLQLFWSFFKIGCFTFGGGFAMIQLIQREIIDRRKWISAEDFLDLLALAQSAPGPIAVNTAVFVGYKVHGKRGALATTLGTILPSFVMIPVIAIFFHQFRDNPTISRIFKGMRPAVVALIVGPIYALSKGLGPYRILLAICAAATVWWLSLSPIYLIIAGAIGGYLYGIYQDKNRKR